MVKIWLVCFLILGFAYQSLATLETLQDEVTLLKGAFQRQIDELTKQVYALREEVDGLEKENFKKDQGKTPYCNNEAIVKFLKCLYEQ